MKAHSQKMRKGEGGSVEGRPNPTLNLYFRLSVTALTACTGHKQFLIMII